MAKSVLKIFDDLMLDDVLAPLMFSEKGRYAGLGILILSGILFFATLINAFISWHADFVISHYQAAANHTVNAVDGDMQLIAGIPSRHLFGQSPLEDSDFLPVTSLQLRLTGIVKNSQDKLSKVIISAAGQPGKVYSVGDEVAAGIKINAINDDSIVLAHEGRFEKLPLARPPLLFDDMPKPLWHDVA